MLSKLNDKLKDSLKKEARDYVVGFNGRTLALFYREDLEDYLFMGFRDGNRSILKHFDTSKITIEEVQTIRGLKWLEKNKKIQE